MFEDGKIFESDLMWKKHFMLTKAAFIWSKIQQTRFKRFAMEKCCLIVLLKLFFCTNTRFKCIYLKQKPFVAL